MAETTISAEPVRDAADFIGREREIVQISELLAAGRSCVLIGPAGSGKTSILNHLAQTAALVLDTPPLVVALDLAGVRTSADLYAPILRALGAAGDDELALGQALAQPETAPLVLLLDRLDQAGGGFSGLVRSALRGWIRDGRLLVVAASSASLAQAAPDLQAVLLQISLPPMPEREARALVQHWLEQTHLSASAMEISDLIAVAGGYPERLRRAMELWLRSERGATFDWVRTFRTEFPQQAVLDTSVNTWTPALETSSEEPQTTVQPSRASLRRRLREAAKTKPERGYQAEDLGEALIPIMVLALAAFGWWAVGTWWGILAFIAVLLLFVALANLLLRYGSARWQTSAFVAGIRLVPWFGRLVKRP